MLVSHLQAGAAPLCTTALEATRMYANGCHEPAVHSCQHAFCALIFTCTAADTLHEQQKVSTEQPHPPVQTALNFIEKRANATEKAKISLALRGTAEPKRKEGKADAFQGKISDFATPTSFEDADRLGTLLKAY